MMMNSGLSAFLVGLLLSLPAFGAGPDLIAHGTADRIWVAHMVRDSQMPPPGRLTRVWQRKIDGRWQPPFTLQGRIAALASRGSDPAILFEGGGWRIFWTDGGTLTGTIGLPLPDGGRILTFATDSRAMWAIVEASPHPATTRSTTTRSGNASIIRAATTTATTRATTGPAPALFLYSLDFTQWAWQNHGPIPGKFRWNEDEPPSLAVVDHRPVLAAIGHGPLIEAARYEPAGKVATSMQSSTRAIASVGGHGRWEELPAIPLKFQPRQFKALGDAERPGSILVWAAGPDNAGDIYELKSGQWNGPIPLEEKAALSGQKTIALSGGRLRLFYEQGKPAALYARQFDLTGKPVGAAAPLEMAASQFGQIEFYLEAVLMAALVIAVIGTFYRRRQAPKPLPPQKLALASYGYRFAAGMIDAAPIIAAIIVAAIRLGGKANLSAADFDPQLRWILLGGFFIYLLYTSVAEILTARTIGKAIFGLRVVTVEGTVADWSALLMRNVLRIVDIWLAWIPLVLIFYTPLRQRIGDVAAATTVVSGPPLPQSETQDSKDSGEKAEEKNQSVTK